MLKKHRKFCRCGLTHLDATPTFKNRPNTYAPPCIYAKKSMWVHLSTPYLPSVHAPNL